MICGTCGRDNPGHLTFCEECGQRLAPRVAPPTPPVGLAQPSFVPSRTVPLTPPQPSQQPPTFGAGPPAAPRPSAPDVRFAPRPAQPSASATPEQARCATCGSINQRGLRFCVACGQQLEGAQPATQAHVPSLSPVAHTAPQPIVPSPTAPPALQPIAHAAQAAIAPARVVDLGGPPIVKSSARVCARCRGTCDANAQFCKFCGAPLGDPTASLAPSPLAPLPASRESAMPDTPPIDPHAYRPFQAMSAASSNAGAPTNQAASSASTARAPVDPRAETGLMSAVAIGVSPPTAVRGRIVIIARDGGEGPAFPLAEITDVGRTEGNVLLAEDRYISPRHARITRRGDLVTLRDLGSVNGIYLRIPVGAAPGLSVPPPPMLQTPNPNAAHAAHAAMTAAPATWVVLEDQDLFLVGQQVLRFEVVNDAEEGFGTASQHGTLLFGTPAAPRYARLSQRTVEGVTRDVFYIRKVETVLGRESGDIVFTEDPFLSRRHAAIHYDREMKRFNLADLGSSNGTFLQIREEVRLKDGDHFRIGQQLFRIDLEPSAGPIGAAPQMAAPRS